MPIQTATKSPTACDPMPVTAAHVRQLLAEQAEKIDLICEQIRPLGQNAVIELVRKQRRANQKAAAVYLERSDTFLRPFFHDPGDDAPDPNKLNGRKGAKEWSITVAELDRFDREVLRVSALTSDSGGVEIRSPSR